MASKPMICAACGSTGDPKLETPGSFLVELLLWCFLLLPGLIYSLWRISARRKVCGACGGQTLIPLNSPRGRKLQQEG